MFDQSCSSRSQSHRPYILEGRTWFTLCTRPACHSDADTDPDPFSSEYTPTPFTGWLGCLVPAAPDTTSTHVAAGSSYAGATELVFLAVR